MSTSTSTIPPSQPSCSAERPKRPLLLVLTLLCVVGLGAAGCASRAPMSGPGIGAMEEGHMQGMQDVAGSNAANSGAGNALPAVGSTIDATLSEWKIAVPTTLAAGKYNFHITNVGKMEHEMLVVKTDLAPAQLPLKNGDFNEDALPPMSDGPNVAPGATQDRTIDLTKPGKYLFVCNLPGHFAQHMYTYVTVK